MVDETQSFDSLPAVARSHLESMIERFENAWECGEHPMLDHFLSSDEPYHVEALIQLTHVDLERRLKAGEKVHAENYLERYPQLAEREEVLFQLLSVEIEQRRRQQPDLSLDEFIQRFSQFQDGIRKCWQNTSPVKSTLPSGGRPPEPTSDQEAQTLVPGPDRYATLRPAEPDSPATGIWPTIPGYEILDELGRGGMGVVYKARQISLKRVVALKMILAGAHAGPEELARFRREAVAVAQVVHPNVVQIHEVAEHEGRPYISLEYLDGGSLGQKLNGTPLPQEEAVRLIEIVARAVDAAHQQGIIHRDLKPGNILLAKRRDAGATLQFPDGGPQMSGGIHDPELLRRVQQRAERARKELLERFGVQELGVQIIREMRDAE
jgi:eukaryotic-like serine/threonine-protein kinase